MTNGGGISNGTPDNPQRKRTCFIVCPIGEERSEIRKRSDQVKKYIIDPAITPLGYETTRADLTDESGQITTQIVTQLLGADLIIADLTGHNPNVFHELAIRHAFGKPFIQIGDKSERIPFDVAGQWSVLFDHKDLDSVDEAKKRINRAAQAIRDGGDEYKTDNPVTQTVDLQQLRSSGNPEQIAMAEITEMITDLRTEVRRTRPQVVANGYSSDQLAALRQVLLGMAADGRFGRDNLEILQAVPPTRNFKAFLEALTEAMAKPSPWRTGQVEDPWGGTTPRSAKFAPSDDEPPF